MATLAVPCLAAFPAWATSNAATPNPDPAASVAELPRPGSAAPDEAARARVSAAYGKLPISFEANRGQTDARVDFLSRGSGYSLFLTSTEAVAVLRNGTAGGSSVLRMELVGGNPSPPVAGQEALPGTSNYFIGNDPAQWHTGIPTFGRVRYGNVWPGIDLAYHGNNRQLEYDFIVAPHANPNAIRLGFKGARKMRVDRHGDLVLRLAGGELRTHKPVAYQEVDGGRSIVTAAYVINSRNKVGIRVGAYDPSRALVIDPTVVYSTYLGGSGGEGGDGIAVDAAGDAYVTGSTGSTDFPTTAGAFQTTLKGLSNVYVTKFNPAGSGLLYSTYLGGSSIANAQGIAVDAAGDAYVTGRTNSKDFPTTAGAFQTANQGSIDAFVTKLNPTGSGLVYSTYLGGSSDDQGQGIAVDDAGAAYVAGYTSSANFPTTAGAFQTTLNGGQDAVVTKLNPAGSGLVYSTYLGGGKSDWANGIAVDAGGDAYVTGVTSGPDFPTTAGAFQTIFAGGFVDAFVTKLNPAGSGLLYSTYLGGSSGDEGFGIAVDDAGDAYVTGYTQSTHFPTTAGAFEPLLHGSQNAFVTRLNPAGSSLVYSTYLGGSSFEQGDGIAVDAAGDAYVTGWTQSADFPITAGAFQTTLKGTRDAFVSKLNPVGSGLLYSTYLGGSGGAEGNGVAVDAAGEAYVIGDASANFPTTAAAFQTAYAGGGDGFVTKLALKPKLILCCGDFNGDGKADILWRNDNGSLWEWWLSGTSQIGGGSSGTATTDWQIAGIGDFNGDGRSDIIWRNNTTGQVYEWQLNGTSVIGGGSLGTVSNDWQIAGIGDFNGDGNADILWLNRTSGEVYEWWLSGTGVIGGGAPGNVSLDWQVAGIGDFNGDGKADILWRNNTTGQVYEWQLNGTSVIGGGSLGTVSTDWQVAGIGDFNGDGKSDILWRNSNSGEAYEWWLSGTGSIGGGSLGIVATDWQIAGIGDVNGDGISDIILRNNTTGEVFEWWLNGTSVIGGGTPGAATTDWQIE